MSKAKKSSDSAKDEEKYPLPVYPASEDIYSKEKEEHFEEDEDETLHAKLSENLDVPGADEDDEDEMLGEEDEENNYYSLGGDDHNDLEETNEDVLDNDQ